MDAQRWELPDTLPFVERQVVRVVVLDSAYRVLLFHTHDPTYPELGEWWELPGGGIETGETYAQAAIRELREETGIAATEAQVGTPTWRRHATFRYRGERRLQHETVVTVQLTTEAPPFDGARTCRLRGRGLLRPPLVARRRDSRERRALLPGALPDLVRTHLRGETIDEPYEVWSSGRRLVIDSE